MHPSDDANSVGLSERFRPQIVFPFLRFDEDWSYLQNTQLRVEATDRLKFIPLKRNTGAYVSLGGEVKQVYEFYNNQYWGEGSQDAHGWLTQRYLAHADFHFGSHLRFFGELQSALENGRNGGPRPYDKDKLDAHEAFIDFKTPIRDGSLTVRAGRQEFYYGSGRLIDARYGLNTRLSFDGLKVIARSGKIQVDGFAVRPTIQREGYFNDTPDSQRTLWGVYETTFLRPIVNLDLYYLGLDAKMVNIFPGRGRAVLQTVGGRLWGKNGAIDYNDEVIGQFGSFANGDIRAWSVAVEHGFTFQSRWATPRLVLRSDATSGDNDPKDLHLGTFYSFFAKGKYFGEADLNGPTNTLDLVPAIAVHPTKSATVTTGYGTFWRESIQDGVYGYATNLEKPGGPSRARFIGQQAEIDLDYTVNPHTVLRAVYQHFFAGAFLKQTPPGHDVSYVTVWLDYHF